VEVLTVALDPLAIAPKLNEQPEPDSV